MPEPKATDEMQLRIHDLTLRLEEARETLDAIRAGAVDALVVKAEGEERIYTLEGADRVYRVLVESLSEGALTLDADGVVLYANRRFAEMVNCPLEKVLGTAFARFVSLPKGASLADLLGKNEHGRKGELALLRLDGTRMPVIVSLHPVPAPDSEGLRVALITDLTELVQARDALRHANVVAVLEERNRIAREIHDTLSQVFTGILLQVRVAQRIAQQEPEEAWRLVQRAGELAQQGLADIRRSVWALQPEALEYSDLVGALSRVVAQIASEAVAHMEMHIQGTPRDLPPDVGMNLLRIGQEAMANALRHGQARIVRIELAFAAERVQLRVQDDGQGFDVATQADGGGFGLMGMAQRAERLGGKLTIASQPGRGTEVAVSVVLAAADEEDA